MFVQTQLIPVRLPDGSTIDVAARMEGGEEDTAVFDQVLEFEWKSIEETVVKLNDALTTLREKVKPDKFSVEFGIQIGGKSGKLTALVVEGSASGSFKFTLQWGK